MHEWSVQLKLGQISLSSSYLDGKKKENKLGFLDMYSRENAWKYLPINSNTFSHLHSLPY